MKEREQAEFAFKGAMERQKRIEQKKAQQKVRVRMREYARLAANEEVLVQGTLKTRQKLRYKYRRALEQKARLFAEKAYKRQPEKKVRLFEQKRLFEEAEERAPHRMHRKRL